jgi:hydrogenase/urease accessory protein HupE
MALSPIITPVAMLLELVICALGIWVGYAKKKNYGYLFAVTFLLFALFGYLGQAGLDADSLAVVNLVAVLAGLGGMYLVFQEN